MVSWLDLSQGLLPGQTHTPIRLGRDSHMLVDGDQVASEVGTSGAALNHLSESSELAVLVCMTTNRPSSCNG